MLFLIIHSELTFSEKVFLEKLYQREFRRMWYTAVKILHSKELAEDAVQTTFLKLIQKVSLLKSFESKEVVSKYAYISVKHTALHILNKDNKHVSLEDCDMDINDENADIEKQVVFQNDIDAIQKVIAEMNPIIGDTLYLKCFLGLDYAEIADILSIPINTARTRVYRGREILRNAQKQGEVDYDK